MVQSAREQELKQKSSLVDRRREGGGGDGFL